MMMMIEYVRHTITQADRRARRWRRKRRRGRMYPDHATEISKRSRLPFPQTKVITRYHPRKNTWM